MKRIYLITGVAGFIGSHIAEELLKDSNNFIVGIDNFYSGNKENLNILKGENFKFYEGDIRNFELLKEIIFTHKVQYVFHEAAIASVQKSIKDPLFTNEVNVKGTLNVLESCRLGSVKRIVFASSAAVFGSEPILPKTENSKVAPISPYGYEKLIGEHYMDLYNNLYGLETVILRYFNVYGERQDPSSEYSGVISIFEDNFKKNKCPIIFGDGIQYRDFIYVKDIVRANIMAIHQESNNMMRFICCGTNIKTSLNKLFDILKDKYNKDWEVIYKEARVGDIKESICDNRKLIKLLGNNELMKFEEVIWGL